MALLNKLFKPKWQHKDPEVRKAAINALTDEQTLTSIINDDQDIQVRLMALSRLSSPTALQTYISCDDKQLRDQARQQRLKQLLPDQTTAALDSLEHNEDLISVANLTEDETLRLHAIGLIRDEQALFDIAMSNPVAKVRLAAAQGIQHADNLQALLSYAQGKDKALYRLCKERLQQAKENLQQEQALQQTIEKLIEQMKHLAKSSYSPEYNGKYQLLNQQWQKLVDHTTSNQQAEFSAANDICHSLLKQHAAEEDALQQQLAAEDQAEESRQRILEQIEALELTDDLSAQLQPLQVQWQECHQVKKASEVDNRRYEQGIQLWLTLAQTQTSLIEKQDALNKLLEQSKKAESNSLSFNQKLEKQLAAELKKLPWPTSEQQPALITELNTQLDTLKSLIANLNSTQAESHKQCKESLQKLASAIDEGHLKEANKHHQHAQKLLKKLSQQQSHDIQQSFKQLTARLHEIRDWQGFAAQPKKEALCADMEKLLDSSLAAEVLADKIKDLQDQWKKLGPINPADDKKLWERFKAAADKAYEPCREFFAQVADQRKLNLEKRQQLIEQLNQYEAAMDWENADWPTVQQTLTAARQSFREFSPVDRAAHKSSQQAFQNACDAIYQHIQQEYDRNIAAKEELIKQAKALVELEDLSTAMDACKTLQGNWKLVGLTPVKADQKLWKNFRSACDAVFNRRDEERQAHKAEIEASIQQATEYVEAAETAAQQCDSEHKEKLQQALDAFHNLQLPKGPYQKLRKRLETAQQAQQQLLNDEKVKAAQQSWLALADKLKAIALKSSNADQADSLWSQEAKLPKSIDQNLLTQNWENTPAMGSEEEIRKACINLEILAEANSPEEDKTLRMELQVQRLAAGLGQQGSIIEQLNQQLANWLSLNPGIEWTERFNQSLLKLAAKV